MERLQPVIFHDAWGSTISIPSLQGRPIPSARPESELWMGAHENGPAGLDRADAATLADLVALDPERALGADVVERFGPRLPFLLKVLAPGHAISIQAHPSAEQAAQERARSGSEVYDDDQAKPEMLVAISPFEVFVGLRPHAEVAESARRLGVPRLLDIVENARSASDPQHAMLAGVLAVPAGERAQLVREVVEGCVRLEASPDLLGGEAAAIVRIAEDHPDDIGLVVLVLMHHRVLRPGDYIDVPPGVLHSYVSGLGIEVLANSDNVVRAGLTSKTVNVEELLRIVDTRAEGAVGQPVEQAGGTTAYVSHSDRFRLHRVTGNGPTTLPGDGGPRIVLCLRGQATVSCGAERHELGHVESLFVGAHERDVVAEGGGEVYVVTCG